ncbi:HPP family protein [Paenibacillus soyae]|uniref:HPP family protein n=1 Tax=Paenibacillus soyae TaxID=2969249 RepID=A0A9X2MS03_9BACL|nr:HPP family protein [Paenibacillus soyae]MCR2805290.1 HPP family protein [Paenibacillus soyae]
MRLKAIAICFYIVLIYWISLHIPLLNSLFFPTLGAFSLLFISKPFPLNEMWRIAVGAAVASFIGSTFAQLSTSALSLLATLLIVIVLFHTFKWNAPPIMAIALIPFFAKPAHVWTAPLSVVIVLAGLLLTLYAVAQCEKLLKALPVFAGAKQGAKVESDSGL